MQCYEKLENKKSVIPAKELRDKTIFRKLHKASKDEDMRNPEHIMKEAEELISQFKIRLDE